MKTLKSGLIVLVVIAFLTGAYFTTNPQKPSDSNKNSSGINLALPSLDSSSATINGNIYNFNEKTNTVKSLGDNIFQEIQNGNLIDQENRTLSPDVNAASRDLVQKVVKDSLSDFKLTTAIKDSDLKISSDISNEAKRNYLKTLAKLNKKDFGDFDENYLQIIVDTYQKVNPSSANRLAGIYRNLADDYLNLAVPSDWVGIHKMLVIYAKNSAVVYRAMSYYPTDPFKGQLALEAMDGLVNGGEKIQTILGEKIKEIGS